MVTGVNGFVGQHVARELTSHDIEVYGVGSPEAPQPRDGKHVAYYDAIDLGDEQAARVLVMSAVDAVIHLAIPGTLHNSFRSPQEYIRANARLQSNLYRTAVRQAVRPRFVIASSGTVYEGVAERPSTEESAVKALSPYTKSKLLNERAARFYDRRFGFASVVARGFNQIGPGLSAASLPGSLARQLAKDASPTVQVGNLDAARDYVDVRDAARAYHLLLTGGEPGEAYNICSGQATSGQELLAMMATAANCQPQVEQDPERMRPADSPLSVGSYAKIQAATGWQPTIELAETLRDMMTEQHAAA